LSCFDLIPQKSNLKEKRFILVLGFKGFSPWLLGPMHLGRISWLVGACGKYKDVLSFLYDIQEVERERGSWKGSGVGEGERRGKGSGDGERERKRGQGKIQLTRT
jgi:hypothetical protein